MNTPDIFQYLQNSAFQSQVPEEYFRHKDSIEHAKRTLTESSPLHQWTASGIFEQIKRQLQEFEQELDQEHDLGIMIQLSGEWRHLLVHDVIAIFPSLLVFKGKMDTGESVRLLQHLSQLNLLLRKVKRPHPQQPKRKIGFHVSEEQEE